MKARRLIAWGGGVLVIGLGVFAVRVVNNPGPVSSATPQSVQQPGTGVETGRSVIGSGRVRSAAPKVDSTAVPPVVRARLQEHQTQVRQLIDAYDQDLSDPGKRAALEAALADPQYRADMLRLAQSTTAASNPR